MRLLVFVALLVGCAGDDSGVEAEPDWQFVGVAWEPTEGSAFPLDTLPGVCRTPVSDRTWPCGKCFEFAGNGTVLYADYPLDDHPEDTYDDPSAVEVIGTWKERDAWERDDVVDTLQYDVDVDREHVAGTLDGELMAAPGAFDAVDLIWETFEDREMELQVCGRDLD
jgi:hypothetical protein